MKKRYLKAMSVIEYSMLIAVITAALLGIQIYIKRAVSARWREAADTYGYDRQHAASGIGWEP